MTEKAYNRYCAIEALLEKDPEIKHLKHRAVSFSNFEKV